MAPIGPYAEVVASFAVMSTSVHPGAAARSETYAERRGRSRGVGDPRRAQGRRVSSFLKPRLPRQALAHV